MPEAVLEFALHPDDTAKLTKHPSLARTARSVAITTLWHDTPDGLLASRALSLAQQRGRWRLEALRPMPGRQWPPGGPAPLIAEGASPAGLAHNMPDGLAPIAALRGRRAEYAWRGADALAGHDGGAAALVSLSLLTGHLRGVAAEQPVSRLFLRGEASLLKPVAMELAGAIRVDVPRAGFAASAAAIVQGGQPAPRYEGPPAVTPGLQLSESVAELIGQLLDTMLHWSDGAGAGATPVPVHQMRVATRRLRSALAVFKSVAAFPDLVPLSAALGDAAARLGAARDWDVFLDGTAERIGAAFPGDRRVRALVSAARRRRLAAYAGLRAYLASAAFRTLEVGLACACVLRPWDRESEPDPMLHQDTAMFARAALDRQWKRVRRAGRGLSKLPVEAMHELRKDCKRLRYTAEFFTPLFPERPGRRFVKRLAALQDELGSLNDGAVAAGLMAHLGRAEQGYAAGVVGGYVAASAAPSRAQIGRAWKRFQRAAPFWS